MKVTNAQSYNTGNAHFFQTVTSWIRFTDGKYRRSGSPWRGQCNNDGQLEMAKWHQKMEI